MRIDFNILWVEDQTSNVVAQMEALERIMRKEGFRLRAEFAKSVQEASKFLNEDVFRDHIDLILMDYNLGLGGTGIEGILNVRAAIPYKEVVFYSAQATDLRRLLREADVDGIYISNRDDLTTTVEGVFQMLVKKYLDIEHSRGIVMGATSEIDHLVNECLVISFDACTPEERSAILIEVRVRLEEIKGRFATDSAAIEKATHLSELRSKYATYTSVDRFNLLRKILGILKLHSEDNDALCDYVRITTPKRNQLAHLKVVVAGFSRKLFDGDSKELTVDDMRELRLSLLRYLELLNAIHRTISGFRKSPIQST